MAQAEQSDAESDLVLEARSIMDNIRQANPNGGRLDGPDSSSAGAVARSMFGSGHGNRNLQRFTLYGCVAQGHRDSFLTAALKDPVVERSVGAMVGMAVADALGAPLEFLPACEPGHFLDPDTMKYTHEFNKFRLKRGQWTDDCSMGLCIADSLLVCAGYDGSDIRVRFWNWWFCNYCNAFRKDMHRQGSVGLGGNIAQSLAAMAEHPAPKYEAETEDSGNGSLMRLAPIPIYFHRDLATAALLSSESSYTTHPGPIAAEVCGFVGYTIARALTREASAAGTSAEFLDLCVKEYLEVIQLLSEPEGVSELDSKRILWTLLCKQQPVGSKERCWDWRDPKGPYIVETLEARGHCYNGYPVSAGYFGAYSVDGLAVALHCIYHTRSFMDAVVRCVNFLGDADSTGSICGQIAGAFYGYGQIDPRCVRNLEQWDDREVALRGALLCVLARDAPAIGL